MQPAKRTVNPADEPPSGCRMTRAMAAIDQGRSGEGESGIQYAGQTGHTMSGARVSPETGAIPSLGPLGLACGSASCVTILTAFVPVVGALPLLHWMGAPPAATQLGWYISPSLSYVGQGMIMGLRPALSMGAGAIIAWGVLGPMAMRLGWAPGPVSSWDDGAKGWVVWVSLGIMLGESIITLGGTVYRYACMLCTNMRTVDASTPQPEHHHVGSVGGR